MIIEKKISELQIAIIKTVLYFDVFDYPLNLQELYEHVGRGRDYNHFETQCLQLVEEGFLIQQNDLYGSVLVSPKAFAKREKGNANADMVMPEAIKWGLKLHHFPFVRSVSISGSLSKQYFDAHSDFDFFVVTKANRLWICRTLVTLYWKLLPNTSKKKLCANYFVDETLDTLDDQNRFTATELLYLLPITGAEVKQKILNSNDWIHTYINNKVVNTKYEKKISEPLLKRITEGILNLFFGLRTEQFIMKNTFKRWRKKFPDMTEADFDLQFRTRKNVAKRHTKGFQNKVLLMFEQRIQVFEKHMAIVLK